MQSFAWAMLIDSLFLEVLILKEKKEKQVLIPLSLLHDIIDFLDQYDIPLFPENARVEHAEIMSCLISKLAKLNIRESYSQIVFAQDDDSRDMARMEYLKRKYYHHVFTTRA